MQIFKKKERTHALDTIIDNSECEKSLTALKKKIQETSRNLDRATKKSETLKRIARYNYNIDNIIDDIAANG